MAFTLADYLRSLPDDRLAELIRLRQDLVIPVPPDLAALAARAQSRLSVGRTLDDLDEFTLRVLDGLRLTRQEDGVLSLDAVLAMTAPLGVEAARVRGAMETLRRRCVVYGPERELRLVTTVDEVCSPYPAGLGRPATELDSRIAALASDPARLRRAVLAAPPQARAVLDRLAGDSPIGTMSPASLAAGSDSPVRWLIEAHLLARVTEEAVELPREIGLLLRRDTGPLGRLRPDPPEPPAVQVDPATVDQAGAGQAMEVVRSMEALLEELSGEPAGALRSGGIGVRDLRRLAKAAGVDDSVAGLLVEIASAAGLLGEFATEVGEVRYPPTVEYDTWRVCDLASRWMRLVSAWLGMTRAAALIGQRDDRDRPINALSGEVERTGAPSRRMAILGVLAEVAPGAAVGAEGIIESLRWRAPRRTTRMSMDEVVSALAEAAAIGVTGFGALTRYARPLFAALAEPERGAGTAPPAAGAEVTEGSTAPTGADEADRGIRSDHAPEVAAALRALDALLPSPVDHVMVQADLTIVVPGPAEATLAAELALVADAESPSVFRVSDESIRRALDTGYAASDLHQLFARRSRTPVPQALTYLVDDVARRHGGLRAGPAGGYLRGDDEALLCEVVADRRLSSLGLRRIAPTVLISPYSPGRLLPALRSAGYAPVAEDASGAALLSRPKSKRAPRRSRFVKSSEDPLAPPKPAMPRLAEPRVAGIVEQLRRGDAATRAARRAPVTVRTAGGTGSVAAGEHAQALAVLQRALRESSKVWVGYVDAHGSQASRLVRPVSMGGGYLRAEDDRTEMLHTFALHRITAASIEE